MHWIYVRSRSTLDALQQSPKLHNSILLHGLKSHNDLCACMILISRVKSRFEYFHVQFFLFLWFDVGIGHWFDLRSQCSLLKLSMHQTWRHHAIRKHFPDFVIHFPMKHSTSIADCPIVRTIFQNNCPTNDYHTCNVNRLSFENTIITHLNVDLSGAGVANNNNNLFLVVAYEKPNCVCRSTHGPHGRLTRMNYNWFIYFSSGDYGCVTCEIN